MNDSYPTTQEVEAKLGRPLTEGERAILGPPEDLDPELAEWLEQDGPLGPMIRHPLVYSMIVHPTHHAALNAQLKAKRAQLPKAIEEKNWHQWIFLHERPYRAEALANLEMAHHEDIDDPTYWELVRTVWMDTENTYQWIEEHSDLLENPDRDLSQRQRLMSDIPGGEFQAPHTLTIFRGMVLTDDDEENDYRRTLSWSWTLDRDRARWFARRFYQQLGGHPVLITATVHSSEVIAFLDGRSEAEVVVNPVHVTEVDVRDVTIPNEVEGATLPF